MPSRRLFGAHCPLPPTPYNGIKPPPHAGTVESFGLVEESESVSTLAIIPARYASSRFPGKPLALIAGKPMIQWVVEQASRVPSFDRVIVATDDERIVDAVQAFGGHVAMTSPDHASGTDRIWEVARQYPDAAYVFNVQGDEPLINPLYLEEAASVLTRHHKEADMVTLKAPIHSLADYEDPNVVKVVTTQDGRALYFSRSPIPADRDKRDILSRLAHSYRHVGIYGFRRSALERFVQLPVSPLETLEKLEQLRALEAGMTIYVLPIPEVPFGVDTPADLAAVEARLSQQSIA